jgi:hypothetical protein
MRLFRRGTDLVRDVLRERRTRATVDQVHGSASHRTRCSAVGTGRSRSGVRGVARRDAHGSSRAAAPTRALPVQDRAELALWLLDSVGDEPASEVERAWIEEAKHMLAEIERGEVSTAPWAEARARIFAR